VTAGELFLGSATEGCPLFSTNNPPVSLTARVYRGSLVYGWAFISWQYAKKRGGNFFPSPNPPILQSSTLPLSHSPYLPTSHSRGFNAPRMSNACTIVFRLKLIRKIKKMDFIQLSADGRDSLDGSEQEAKYQELPRLETKQTASLRSEYPLVEYLESGQIADWLKERKDQLLVFAREERVGVAISKTVGAAATLAGFIFHATSPLAPIGGLLGAVGYLWAQIRDTQHTHTFSPIPFVRGNLLDTVGSFGHSEARKELISNWDEFEQLKGYLPPTEQHEYTMLRQHFITVTDIIKRIEPYKRFHAYRLLLDFYIESKGYFPEPNDLDAHMMNVEVDTRVDYEIVAAIQERQSQSQLVSSHNNPKFMTTRRAEYAPSLTASSVPVASLQTQLKGDNKLQDSTNAEKSPVLTAQPQFKWLHQVLKLPFRILSGEQGSGKSTLERWMISLLKEAGYHIVCINPETNPSVWKGVEVLADCDQINRFLREFLDDVRARQQECREAGMDEDDYFDLARSRSGKSGLVAIFFMETNTYEVHGINADLWAEALKQCLTNIRKWGFTACLTAHSDNQTSVSSKLKGFSGMINAMPRVDCIAQPHPETGEASSSGRAWFRMKGINDPAPKQVELYNYPKTKDFRTDAEKQAAIATPPVSELPQQQVQTTSPSTSSVATPVNQVSLETESVRETVLQDAAITVIKNSEVDSNSNDEAEEITNSRENDFMFIMTMAEIASAHINENEWVNFNTEQLRRINKFRGADAAGRHLNRNEGRAVAKVLSMQNKLQIISEDNYRANID
jgi:hypothetical protein